MARCGARVAGGDDVKMTLGISRYDLSGYEVAEALIERGVVIEKAGVHTITFISTFQLGSDGGARHRARAHRRPRRPRAAVRARASRCPPTRSGRSTTAP